MIFVIYGQDEVLVILDCIVVMVDGYMQQVGILVEIYCCFEMLFVVGFIGFMNFVLGVIDIGVFVMLGFRMLVLVGDGEGVLVFWLEDVILLIDNLVEGLFCVYWVIDFGFYVVVDIELLGGQCIKVQVKFVDYLEVGCFIVVMVEWIVFYCDDCVIYCSN